MSVEIVEIGPGELARYASVPIAFRVESVLCVDEIDGGLGGFRLTEEPVAQPGVKDYNAFEGDAPTCWGERFDISRWGFFLALDGTRPVGGAAVAWNTPDLLMLEGVTDLAVLWDIRVHPEHQRRGIGAALLKRAADWARGRKCSRLKIETQNVNVPACRFYASQGCRLGAIARHCYHEPQLAHEVMLLWYLDL
jgi:GNAT superfamily N-acetyltransferase